MTDPTPEMVAMARRIAPVEWCRNSIVIDAICAAIIETSEMAARYAATCQPDEPRELIATALRAYDHIKPENG